jgi:fermentation-respiration switch protein FrsA (DUF1100 family)
MYRLKIILISIVVLYLLGAFLFYFLQEKLIFLDEPLPNDFTYHFDRPFTEENISMKDGAVINLLHFEAPDSKGLILYFHGNAGNLERWGQVVYPYVDLSYDVAILDYRGYGKSTGKRTEENLFSDAQTIYDYYKATIPEEQIIIFGRSLGTSMAVYLAANNHPRKLILETPFYSLQSLAQKIVPIFPSQVLLRFPFRSDKYIQQVKCPVYLFHGTEDEVVPYEQSEKLFKLVQGSQGAFYTIEGGSHNNLIEFEKFRTAMKNALEN